MRDENEVVEDNTAPDTKATQVFENTNEEYIHRVDLNSHKAAMGVHSVETRLPFPVKVVNDTVFYKIGNKYWQLGYAGSDDDGIFVMFWKVAGTYKPTKNIW